MTPGEYVATQGKLLLIAGHVATMDLEGFLGLHERLDVVGNITDPELALRSRQARKRVKRIAVAAAEFQKTCRAMQDELVAAGLMKGTMTIGDLPR